MTVLRSCLLFADLRPANPGAKCSDRVARSVLPTVQHCFYMCPQTRVNISRPIFTPSVASFPPLAARGCPLGLSQLPRTVSELFSSGLFPTSVFNSNGNCRCSDEPLWLGGEVPASFPHNSVPDTTMLSLFSAAASPPGGITLPVMQSFYTKKTHEF